MGKYSFAPTNWAEITISTECGPEVLMWQQFTTGGSTPDACHPLFSTGGDSFMGKGSGSGTFVSFTRWRSRGQA